MSKEGEEGKCRAKVNQGERYSKMRSRVHLLGEWVGREGVMTDTAPLHCHIAVHKIRYQHYPSSPLPLVSHISPWWTEHNASLVHLSPSTSTSS